MTFLIHLFLIDLGHQTAQRIVHASDPLQSMQEISQNFPTLVSALSRMKVIHSLFLTKVNYDISCSTKHYICLHCAAQ